MNQRYLHAFVDTDGRVVLGWAYTAKTFKVRFQCNKDCGATRNIYLSAKVERWGKVHRGKPRSKEDYVLKSIPA